LYFSIYLIAFLIFSALSELAKTDNMNPPRRLRRGIPFSSIERTGQVLFALSSPPQAVGYSRAKIKIWKKLK